MTRILLVKSANTYLTVVLIITYICYAIMLCCQQYFRIVSSSEEQTFVCSTL